ncbi:MAG: DnaB-like helicase C-terminal domain-containing protein [Sarcina sp.]
MDLKKIVSDIKLYIDAEQVKNKIATDLNLVIKNGKSKCIKHIPSAETVLSFDSKRKCFKCFSCNLAYDIFDHYQEYYNKSFLEAIKSIVSDFNLNIDVIINDTDRNPVKPPTIHNSYTDKVLSYCNKRGISKNTVDYVGVKEEKGNVCFEYKNELGEHITNKYRFTKKGANPKMRFEKDTNINTLFNMDKVDITKPLLITEGEFDTLASIEAGFRNSVSIPSGVNSTNQWIAMNWDFLEQFEEIIIWFDNDEAGIKGSREVFNRLSNKSVKLVMCDMANDINELLYKYGKEEVLKQIGKAYTPLVGGVVSLDMVEDYNIFEADKLETGIDNIDNEILGMVFGSLNILSGRNGAGKSTILNQIYIGEAIKQQQKVFLFSGELVAGNVKEWLLKTLANERDLIEFTAKNDRKYKVVSSEGKKNIVDKIKDKFYLYDSDDYRIDTVIAKMEILAKRQGVKVFIIDNLMILEMSTSDEYKAQSEAVKKLKAFAKKYNSIVHLVAHPRKSQNDEISKDDVAGSANITNLADYVTILERNFKEDREYDAKLSIVKNRHTGTNASVALKFDMDRKRFYSNSNKTELMTNYFNNEFTQIYSDEIKW